MATITLMDRFELIPEGTDIFRIYAVEYKEAFGALKVYLVNAKGNTTIMNYNFIDKNGMTNDTAYRLFSWFARSVLNDNSIKDVDPEMLIDRYVQADAIHTEVVSRDDPNQTKTFVNLKNFSPADGFTEEPTERAMTLGHLDGKPVAPVKPEPVKEVVSPKSTADLMALLSN